jgi:hypothetical protein
MVIWVFVHLFLRVIHLNNVYYTNKDFALLKDIRFYFSKYLSKIINL